MSLITNFHNAPSQKLSVIMTAISLFVSTLCLYQVQSYYVSPLKLTLPQSIDYCYSRCDSSLASFASQNDFEYSKYIAASALQFPSVESGDSNDIRIGLFDKYSHGNFSWLDETPKQYGFDLSTTEKSPLFGQYPWIVNSPTADLLMGDGSVTLVVDDNYRWTNSYVAQPSRTMCNSCNNGVINKYIPIYKQLSHSDANTYCQDTLGTSLASIHSDMDNTEASYLSTRFFSQTDVWIGLSFNDHDGDDSFSWTDDSTFDYGNNYTLNASYYGDHSGIPWYHGYVSM